MVSPFNFRFLKFTQNFNIFYTNFEVLLLRLGFTKSIRESRIYIKAGVLKVNNHIVRQNRHLMHCDIFKFSKVPVKIRIRRSIFDKKIRKYVLKEKIHFLDLITYAQLLVVDRQSDIKKQHKFLGLLPGTSTFNYRKFSCYYFNILMKNQWHFFIDFFVAKKFLQYAR